MESKVTFSQVQEYLYFLYFGDTKDVFEAATRRAYLDFNRTMHEFGKHPNRQLVYQDAKTVLKGQLHTMLCGRISNQDDFDQWHRACCDQLIGAFGEYKFFYGQAQKWINMALKYLFVLNRDLTANKYQYFHVPIDNVILNRVKALHPPIFKTAWSRIGDYDKYLQFQYWFRKEFEGNPLDNEFELWMK